MLDEAEADRYRSIAQRSIEQHGGRYIVRGALPDAVEGEWDPARRLVIVEFRTLEAARKWCESPEYAEALDVRTQASCSSTAFSGSTVPCSRTFAVRRRTPIVQYHFARAR